MHLPKANPREFPSPWARRDSYPVTEYYKRNLPHPRSHVSGCTCVRIEWDYDTKHRGFGRPSRGFWASGWRARKSSSSSGQPPYPSRRELLCWSPFGSVGRVCCILGDYIKIAIQPIAAHSLRRMGVLLLPDTSRTRRRFGKRLRPLCKTKSCPHPLRSHSSYLFHCRSPFFRRFSSISHTFAPHKALLFPFLTCPCRHRATLYICVPATVWPHTCVLCSSCS